MNKSSLPFNAIGADHGIEQENRTLPQKFLVESQVFFSVSRDIKARDKIGLTQVSVVQTICL